MRTKLILVLLFYFWINNILIAQDIALYQQFNGRYDYYAIGNTLNVIENGTTSVCTILNSSSAELDLDSENTIIAAYLYWAGSGDGDFNVSLNGINVNAERTFSDAIDINRNFFAAFTDVTTIVQNTGNGMYTFSDLNLETIIPPYCPTGTNFGGWAITVIYENPNLPLNQLNVYDGLQSVPEILDITLNNIDVLDNNNAKIGFIAWEGDQNLAVNEQLLINGNIISNPPLNPSTNAFNGTNSFTGASNLYNMDIDVYNIQNNINIGDTSANITLTSGQDFVMINNIITVLNSQLPDASVDINHVITNCGTSSIDIQYTVNNFNSTSLIPVNTPIRIYINNQLVFITNTLNDIPINGSETYNLTLNLTENYPDEIELRINVDDDGITLNGTLNEIIENNNTSAQIITLRDISPIETLPPLTSCDMGFGSATFNLFDALDTDQTENSFFFLTEEDAIAYTNPINTPESYTNINNPETIYMRLESNPCFSLLKFNLNTEICPPFVPQAFSPNNDSFNDWFNIQGLYDIFINHKLEIYNRYGELIFVGNNELKWEGFTNRGINNIGTKVPVGTYFYILHLNEPSFQDVIGWVYVNY